MQYQDILYEERDHTATITINRPDVYNAFRPRTVLELIDAFCGAGWNGDIGSIVLTGAGDRAFCTGGDQSDHDGGYSDGANPGHRRHAGIGGLGMQALKLYYDSDESKEGVAALQAKREPNFRRYAP